ncbi:SAVED domain-containing protein [Ktedonobacteria bacterium brp13]|nr:SAVED domain-containing protein [Ktedonobacteria bacterium brp13]
MDKKNTRPNIPEQIQRELWARAAGRCEFRGCNKLLYKDSLTQKRANLAVISHIVAYSSNGPRGDIVRSQQLEKDISNLMLTCRDHGKIIDDKEREIEYPEELLLEFKREHELRIRMLTEAKEDAQTYVLLLQVPIDKHPIRIDQAVAFRAILPKYPAEEMATVIDLNGMTIPTASAGFFQVAVQSITEQTRRYLHNRFDKMNIKNLAVFALAPVPLLIYFGYLLGDIDHVDLFQRHRDSQNWIWKDEAETEEGKKFYKIFSPETTFDSRRKIALLLSVSNLVKRSEVEATLGEEPLVYEIRAEEPGLDFFESRKRLEAFGYEVRKLLESLRVTYDHTCEIHLFAAVPSPAAIEFGRHIQAHHPLFLVYEYQKATRVHLPALQVNIHSREQI